MNTKHLILVHGRSFKPASPDLEALWFDALHHGLQRAASTAALTSYDMALKTFIYYGDISNAFLLNKGRTYDVQDDLTDRRACLTALQRFQSADFIEPRGKTQYNRLPGASGWKRRSASAMEGLDFVALAAPLIRRCAPDVAHYWNTDSQFGSDVRWRLTQPLRTALEEQHDICLIAHSLGTMVAYDVLWKLSYYGEYQSLRQNCPRVNLLLTLGSPLGNRTVRKHLKGGRARGLRRYPTLIRRWQNFAAKDDYIAHDSTLADDYSGLSVITDHRIYNLAVRHGKAHPHHGTGYLIHPQVAEAVSTWLR